MSNYYSKYTGFRHDDELIGGSSVPVKIANVEVGSTTTITRGQILASATPDGTYAPAGSGDANKNLAIAAADFTGSSELTVTQAYTSGVFNREKLTPSDTSIFELELRRQNIHLTSILPNYDE